MAREGLEAWQDATLQPEPLPPEEVAWAEARRLQKLADIAAGAVAIPRRLGGEATGRELAHDKRKGRRILHIARRLESWWDAPVSEDRPATSRDSAQIVWDEWWSDHKEWLDRRITWIATWGVKHNNRSAANKYVSLLRRERQYLERVFIDNPLQ